MNIKIVEVNSDGKILITKEELISILDEAYNEGYAKGKNETNKKLEPTWTYNPYSPLNPYVITTASNGGASTIKTYLNGGNNNEI